MGVASWRISEWSMAGAGAPCSIVAVSSCPRACGGSFGFSVARSLRAVFLLGFLACACLAAGVFVACFGAGIGMPGMC